LAALVDYSTLEVMLSFSVSAMKLLRTKVWYWWDIALLKWSALLFGMIFGALFTDLVKDNVGGF
jgi:hypothetical protein